MPRVVAAGSCKRWDSQSLLGIDDDRARVQRDYVAAGIRLGRLDAAAAKVNRKLGRSCFERIHS